MENNLHGIIFASLFNRKRMSLSYGVMVAQQFLVLFVVVRIRLGQHNDGFLFIEEAFVVLRRKGKIVVVRIRQG